MRTVFWRNGNLIHMIHGGRFYSAWSESVEWTTYYVANLDQSDMLRMAETAIVGEFAEVPEPNLLRAHLNIPLVQRKRPFTGD